MVSTKVIPRLLQFAADSDVESDVEFTDTESEDEDYGARGAYSSRNASGWRAWCNLMWQIWSLNKINS